MTTLERAQCKDLSTSVMPCQPPDSCLARILHVLHTMSFCDWAKLPLSQGAYHPPSQGTYHPPSQGTCHPPSQGTISTLPIMFSSYSPTQDNLADEHLMKIAAGYDNGVAPVNGAGHANGRFQMEALVIVKKFL